MKTYTLNLECQTWRESERKPIAVKYWVKGIGTKRMLTGYYVHPDNWDSANRKIFNQKNADKLNAAIEKKRSDIERLVINKELAGLRLTGLEMGGHTIPFYDDYAKRLAKAAHLTDIGRVHDFCASRTDLPNRPTLAHFDTAFIRDLKTFQEERGLGYSTIVVFLGVLLSVLNTAADEHIILRSQYDGFKPPKEVQGEIDWLNEDEIAKMVAFVRTFKPGDKDLEHVAVASLLLGCLTGLRRSDWQKIVDEQEMRVYETPNGTMLRTITKKSDSKVVIPCGPLLLEVLLHLKGVCITADNKNWKTFLHRALVREEINIARNVTSHYGRHSFGYWAASQGWSESLLATILGVTEAIVKKYYHLTGEHVARQAVAMAKRA